MAKILVVDDAAFMRMRCSKLLTDNGFEVIEAGNGMEAISQYRAESPDAVLLDGIETLKTLVADDPGVRVAMCTAMGQQTMVIEALKSGARDFIVKPFEAERVLGAVNKLLT